MNIVINVCLFLQGDNANVAVESVVAIPEDKWHLDYLKPKQACVKKDGKCVQALFQNPGEAKKVRLTLPFIKKQKLSCMLNSVSLVSCKLTH